jgi:hypothetical protein
MVTSKKSTKKHKIPASDVEIGSRTLEAVLTDLAEVVKECAVRSARAEEVAAEAAKRSASAEERSARAEERSQLAFETIGGLLQDLRALAERTDRRLVALETAAE